MITFPSENDHNQGYPVQLCYRFKTIQNFKRTVAHNGSTDTSTSDKTTIQLPRFYTRGEAELSLVDNWTMSDNS